MKFQRFFAVLFPALVLLAVLSCRKDESDIWVMASPLTSTVFPADPADAGTMDATGFWADTDVFFNMEVVSIHGPLTSLEGTVYDPVNGTVSFLQMELSERSFKNQIAYHTPATDVVLKQVFTFKAVDSQGYTGKYSVSVDVYPSSGSLLEEKTSITLNCSGAEYHNAYSFTTGQTLFYQPPTEEITLEESIADIVLEAAGNGLRFTSATGIKFVRNESFDYPSATASSVRQVFSNSVRSDSVQGIEADDIVLVGTAPDAVNVKAMGVLKVIVKEDSRIVFNLKRVPSL
ncbi:MAG: hypothetical protein ACI39U_03505 [Candidatus Cryptobacteroides sp.]